MQFVLFHGGVKLNGKLLEPAKDSAKPTVLELEPEEAKKIDPLGHCLKPLEAAKPAEIKKGGK